MKQVLETFNAFEGKKFEWGVTDCCQFASHYINLKTGKELAKIYGNYTTEIGALRAQTKHGSFEETMDANFATVEPAMAQRGDVVMFESPFGNALGIRTADSTWAMCQQFGLQPVEHEIIKAWRIA